MNRFACVKVTTVLTESVLVFRTRGDQPNQEELERRGFEVRHNDDHLRVKEKSQNAAFYVKQKVNKPFLSYLWLFLISCERSFSLHPW